MKRQLHPGATWVFRIRGYFSFIIPLFFLMFFTFSFAKVSFNAFGLYLFEILVLIVILTIIFSEIYARMSYTRWFYELTESNLKLERGIIWKRYSNIPYERVQNVDIRRGVIARLLGFSEVDIQTAGYSGGNRTRGMPEGYIPAVSVEEAEKIREFLIRKITKKGRKQGL